MIQTSECCVCLQLNSKNDITAIYWTGRKLQNVFIHMWLLSPTVVTVFFLDVPKFPKETIDPVVVEEGQAFILKCDPPNGIPPLQIYWMTISK